MNVFRWLGLAIAAGSCAQMAVADDMVTYSFDAWQVVCSQANKHECAMLQKGLDSKSGKQVYQVTLEYEGKASQPTLNVLVPLGVALKSGLSVDVEGNAAKPYAMSYELCVPTGCLAKTEMDKKLDAAMQGGNVARIHVKDQAGKEIALPFSLQGYGKAVEKLKESR